MNQQPLYKSVADFLTISPLIVSGNYLNNTAREGVDVLEVPQWPYLGRLFHVSFNMFHTQTLVSSIDGK